MTCSFKKRKLVATVKNGDGISYFVFLCLCSFRYASGTPHEDDAKWEYALAAKRGPEMFPQPPTVDGHIDQVVSKRYAQGRCCTCIFSYVLKGIATTARNYT